MKLTNKQIKDIEKLTGFEGNKNLKMFSSKPYPAEKIEIKIYQGRYAEQGAFIVGRVGVNSDNTQGGIPIKGLIPLGKILGGKDE